MKDEHEQLLHIARASWGAIVGPATESEQGCFDQGFRAAVFALEASLSHAAGQEVEVSTWPLEVGDALLKWNRDHPAGPLIRIGYEYGVAAKVAEIMRDLAPAVARSEGED